MPLFIYKAVAENGQIFRNKVEAMDRFEIVRKLKANGFTPIKVTKLKVNKKSTKQISKQKKNIETRDSVLKTVREQELLRNSTTTKSKGIFGWLKKVVITNNRITNRDIVIFTQNLFLLKKANFNNIHALSTIIETTENPALKDIIEDILLGVESGENMYTTMEYYSGVFPPIYINMIKVGELSRVINKGTRTSCQVFR